ncbi:hypothetical protein BDY21DRAFT_21010 [Lineolata rhizophorae]|uniref:polynucleotide adenylyltransferase n=1 Tax=Lineolata rhizophorae TaxID=578093 RepID=A0A6A6P3E5_9PEZI|nr:hypothetical protein BDY21DRAFT_21010 [Lineolata rhizophorae]
MRPQGFEYSMREALLSRVAAALQACQPGQLFCFGSFASGLFLPNSDMDLVYLSDKFRTTGVRGFPEQTRFLHVMAASLRSHNLTTMQDTEVVGKARVPIIKFVERSTSLKVDISFENMAGVTAIRTFREWRILYPEMPVLVTVIKQFLAMRDLNEVFTGGLGGFTIICLVVSLLQNLPNGLGSQPSKGYNLGELLLEFFNLYGNKFDYLSTGITLDPPGYFAKSCPSNKLSIIDPNNSSNDISSGSHKVDLVFQCFKKAYNKLRKRINHIERYAHRYKDRKSTSILGFILGGDYRSIEWQRRRLRDLHFGRVQDRNIQPLNGNPPIPSGSTSSALNSVGSASSRKVHTFERSEYRTADVELLEEVGFVAVDKDEDMDESESIAPSDLSEDTLQMLSQSVFEVPPPPPPPVSSKKGKRYLPGKQRKSRGQPSGHNRHHSRGRGTTGSYGRGRGSHGYGSGNHGYGSGNHGHGGGNHGHGGGSHGYGSSSRGRGSGGRGRGSHGYGSGNHGHGGGIHGHGSSSRGHGSGARGRGEGGRGGSSRTHPRL